MILRLHGERMGPGKNEQGLKVFKKGGKKSTGADGKKVPEGIEVSPVA